MIDGNTKLIAHLGHPTHSFTAPLIYNPYFEDRGINATVMPMGVTRDHFSTVLDALRGIENFLGALITMPLKIDATRMGDTCSDAVQIAGSCNAIRRRDDGTLEGDLFDGEGFVRAARQRLPLNGCDALVIGCGGESVKKSEATVVEQPVEKKLDLEKCPCGEEKWEEPPPGYVAPKSM